MNKLEECARILAKAAGKNPDYVWTDGKPEWTMYVDDARAVIRCLMEPSREMNFKGSLVGDHPWDDQKPTRVLRAMLQSVLDEGK